MILEDVNLEKDEVTTLFWPGKISEFWDNTFQAVINMSFMPFTVYMNLSEENMEMMDTLTQYHHISDFENWLDSIDDAWF